MRKNTQPRYTGCIPQGEYTVNIHVKQISSLEKIRQTDTLPDNELLSQTVLAGERFSYQICLSPLDNSCAGLITQIQIESELKDHIKVYFVKDAVLDKPVTISDADPEDYITLVPGFMPDILIPIHKQNNIITIGDITRTLWIRVDIPADSRSGD